MKSTHGSADSEVLRLLDGINADGIPLAPRAILDAVEQPHWEATRRIHDWRSHVPPTLRQDWEALPLTTRLCVFETAELAALDEDVGVAMVTGPAG